MRRLAHAKLNLALSVGPPLGAADANAGMHPIASWMHCIDLCDQLDITALAKDQPSSYAISWAPDALRRSAIDWPSEKDLAVRAHRLLEEHTGRALPVGLKLVKRIPVGSGLGGGSSDAAATLVAMNELFQLEISFAELRDLSRSLGSDVAFFIDERASHGPPRPALVTGLGDHILRAPVSAAAALLMFPPFGCATGPVYRAYDTLAGQELREAGVRTLVTARNPAASVLFNDLVSAAEAVQPALGPLRQRISAVMGRWVCMSGSGSTLFVLGAEEADLRAVWAKVRAAVPDVEGVVTRLV